MNISSFSQLQFELCTRRMFSSLTFRLHLIRLVFYTFTHTAIRPLLRYLLARFLHPLILDFMQMTDTIAPNFQNFTRKYCCSSFIYSRFGVCFKYSFNNLGTLFVYTARMFYVVVIDVVALLAELPVAVEEAASFAADDSFMQSLLCRHT